MNAYFMLNRMIFIHRIISESFCLKTCLKKKLFLYNIMKKISSMQIMQIYFFSSWLSSVSNRKHLTMSSGKSVHLEKLWSELIRASYINMHKRFISLYGTKMDCFHCTICSYHKTQHKSLLVWRFAVQGKKGGLFFLKKKRVSSIPFTIFPDLRKNIYNHTVFNFMPTRSDLICYSYHNTIYQANSSLTYL